jgi:hypothetical protein
VFSCGEGQARVLVVVRVRGGDIYNVDVFVVDEFGVGAICFCGTGSVELGEKVLGAGRRRRGCGCDDGVLDIVDGASARGDEEVFCKLFGYAAGGCGVVRWGNTWGWGGGDLGYPSGG